jgi:hypothetical protein
MLKLVLKLYVWIKRIQGAKAFSLMLIFGEEGLLVVEDSDCLALRVPDMIVRLLSRMNEALTELSSQK